MPCSVCYNHHPQHACRASVANKCHAPHRLFKSLELCVRSTSDSGNWFEPWVSEQMMHHGLCLVGELCMEACCALPHAPHRCQRVADAQLANGSYRDPCRTL